MKKVASVLSIVLFISGCAFLSTHKIDIEQGNIVTQEEVNQLHLGMSETEVKAILGSPILINTFSANQANYVYTLQKGHQPMTEKRITCIFKQNHLVLIKK
jgi:outer membrane protein assembly factor BamE